MKTNNYLYVILLTVFSCSLCYGENTPHVSASYKVSKENVTFNFIYSNPTSDTLVFWIQNWRLALLSKRNEKFYGFPYTSSLVNYFIILKDSIDFTRQLSQIEYYSTSVGAIHTPCLKVLGPNERFGIEITCADKELIRFLEKNDNIKVSSIVSFAEFSKVKAIHGVLNFFFSPDKLIVGDLPLGNRSPSDIATHTLDLGRIQDVPASLAFRDLQPLFDSYLIKSVKINK